MSAYRYALGPGAEFVHVLKVNSLVALCGNTGSRSTKRKRAFWVVLTAKCPGPLKSGRRMCVKCKEALRG